MRQIADAGRRPNGFRTMQSTDLRLSEIETFEVKAERRGTKKHTSWSIGLAPEEEEGTSARVVFGTLHAYGENGGGEVLIAGLVSYPEGAYPDTSTVQAAMKESDTAEVLYDAARLVLGAALALTDVPLRLPRRAPKAKFGVLKRLEEAQAEDDDREMADSSNEQQ